MLALDALPRRCSLTGAPLPMRILQLATGFLPQRGGIETVSSLLAREFARLGHASVVLTRTVARSPASHGVEVLRAPSPLRVLHEIIKADAVILHGVPVRLAWPLAFLRKRAVIIKHMWDNPSPSCLRARITEQNPALCVSRYMASLGPAPTGTIANPYDESLFNESDSTAPTRDHDLVFMGRVTRDKGVFAFIELVADLARTHPRLSATIIGDGPDSVNARAQVSALKLDGVIRFTGELAPEQSAAELRRHRIFVFPALWDEPFGIVALEAIACGAVVVGYASGGIPEAIGPCGEVVATGDLPRLKEHVVRLLADETARADLLSRRDAHLARHRAPAVAQSYVEYIQQPAPGPHS